MEGKKGGCPSSEIIRTCGGRQGCFATCFVKNTLVQNVGPYLRFLAHQVVHNHFLVTNLVSILPIEYSCDMRVIVLLPSLLISTAFTQKSCCLGNSVTGQHYLHSQNLGCYSLLVDKLCMSPKGFDKFRIYGLWFIEQVSD